MAEFKNQKEKDDFIAQVQKSEEEALLKRYRFNLESVARSAADNMRSTTTPDGTLYEDDRINEYLETAGKGKTEAEKKTLAHNKKTELIIEELDTTIDKMIDTVDALNRKLQPKPPAPPLLGPLDIIAAAQKQQIDAARKIADFTPGLTGIAMRAGRDTAEFAGVIPKAPPITPLTKAQVPMSDLAQRLERKESVLEGQVIDMSPSPDAKGLEGLLTPENFEQLNKYIQDAYNERNAKIEKNPAWAMGNFDQINQEMTNKIAGKMSKLLATDPNTKPASKSAGGADAGYTKPANSPTGQLGTLKSPAIMQPPPAIPGKREH